MHKTKVHLDTDIGGDIDDLCALALLLSWPDIEITGITTVVERDGKRAGYVRHVLALAGRSDVPVAAGADFSLGYFRFEAGLPLEERYWPKPVPSFPSLPGLALDLLKQSIEQNAIVVAIGPLTNLSLLERRHPRTLRDATLYVMGGSINPVPPNFPAWDYKLDYNMQADSISAKHVLESANPTLVPIEVTAQTALRRSHLPPLRQAGPIGQLIAKQAEVFAQDEKIGERYGPSCPGLPHDIINFQHDPLACAVALSWGGVTIDTLPLSLELKNGWLRERVNAGGHPTRIVTRVDGAKFNSFWLNMVTGHALLQH